MNAQLNKKLDEYKVALSKFLEMSRLENQVKARVTRARAALNLARAELRAFEVEIQEDIMSITY